MLVAFTKCFLYYLICGQPSVYGSLASQQSANDSKLYILVCLKHKVNKYSEHLTHLDDCVSI